jgi:hypothetical protein
MLPSLFVYPNSAPLDSPLATGKQQVIGSRLAGDWQNQFTNSPSTVFSQGGFSCQQTCKDRSP